MIGFVCLSDSKVKYQQEPLPGRLEPCASSQLLPVIRLSHYPPSLWLLHLSLSWFQPQVGKKWVSFLDLPRILIKTTICWVFTLCQTLMLMLSTHYFLKIITNTHTHKHTPQIKSWRASEQGVKEKERGGRTVMPGQAQESGQWPLNLSQNTEFLKNAGQACRSLPVFTPVTPNVGDTTWHASHWKSLTGESGKENILSFHNGDPCHHVSWQGPGRGWAGTGIVIS